MNPRVRSEVSNPNARTCASACRLLWIDWGHHRRTHTLARRLGADLVEVDVPGHRLLRYFRSVSLTLRAVHAHHPEVVIATNPSIVLGFVLSIARILYRFSLVSDAHFVGIEPIAAGGIPQWILDLHNRQMDRVIVTNEAHARHVESLGTPSSICPDPLPDINRSSRSSVALPEKSVFLICSFDADEPYEVAIEAFRVLAGEGYTLHISGNYAKAGVDPNAFPWVRFLGFVSDSEYYGYLDGCSVVMDLTDVDNCLVCGAYEALAIPKPLILSDSRALRDYFGHACVLTNNTAVAIAQSVRIAHESREELESRARTWAEENHREMGETISALRTAIFSPRSS
jgi:hypothetical protein